MTRSKINSQASGATAEDRSFSIEIVGDNSAANQAVKEKLAQRGFSATAKVRGTEITQTVVRHDWSDGAQTCSCGQDTVTCQGCGQLTCGNVAIWKDGKGNVGPCCFPKFGMGHAGAESECKQAANCVWVVTAPSAYRPMHTCFHGRGATKEAAILDAFGPREAWGNATRRSMKAADIYETGTDTADELEFNANN